jgi:hypothetical protein
MEWDPLCLYASCKFDLVCLNDQSYEINDQTRTQVNDDLKCVAIRFTDYDWVPVEDNIIRNSLRALQIWFVVLAVCIQKHTY